MTVRDAGGPVAGSTKPTLVIKPPARWVPVPVGEIWAFRDLMWRFTSRDVRLRYRQTALGVIWVVVQPLLAAGAFSFVFGRVAGLPSEGVPYFVFAYAGLLCWNSFSATVTKAAGSLVGNSALVSKVYFPRMVLPIATLGSTTLDGAVALALGLVLVAASGVGVGATVLAVPLLYAGVQALALGVGMLAGALAVQYRDVAYVLPVATQLLLFASPVAYAVPDSGAWLFRLNPLTGFLVAFRWALLGTPLDLAALLRSVVVAAAVFVLGALAFTRMERRFADVI